MSPAPHPRMHGITHVPGGPDPVPFTSPAAGDYPAVVASITDLMGYWRLGETSGPMADTSGYSLTEPDDLTVAVSGTPMSFDQAGALPAAYDDGAITQNHEGTVTDGTGTADRLIGSFAPGRWNFNVASSEGIDMSVAVWVNPSESINTWDGAIVSALQVAGGVPNYYAGWALLMRWPSREIVFMRAGAPNVVDTASGGILEAGEWWHVAATYDGTDIRLYVNGGLAATVPSTVDLPSNNMNATVGQSIFWDGTGPVAGDYIGRFYGSLDEAAVWGKALTPAEIASLAASTGEGLALEGWVPVADGEGGVTWEPPGVEVEHGGGTPDDTPVNSTSGGIYAGTPESPDGWHYDAHWEIAVLYDSGPGRFDVPSRKWVRVPFDTVRIWRTWERDPASDDTAEAWLPDDRGLTEQARNGLLHIADGMGTTVGDAAAGQVVNGWINIEYPVLDPEGLPASVPAAEDHYVRAIRVLNASTGSVLPRGFGVDPTLRRFIAWAFWEDADDLDVYESATVDNKYPEYPAWPERPLTLPAPYPTLSPAASIDYYTNNETDQPGNEGDQFYMETQFEAGANLCLQAWQDTPWLVRFTTGLYPNYPLRFVGLPTSVWRERPYLSVEYKYDPDLIDHTTGRLLG